MAGDEAADASHVHVLIVDDNTAYAENIAEILELSGCPSEVFTSAEEALPAALSPRTNALITDFRLPGMTGIELIAQVLRERGSLPAIVISAYADDSVVDAAKALGVECHSKPVGPALLQHFVQYLASEVTVSP